MPIVDAHIHLWSHDRERYPDIAYRRTGKSELPAPNGLADDIVREMDAHGVAYALNVQVPWYREDNRYHLDSVARFPGRFAFLAVMDLETPGVGERYERFHHELGARGFRLHHDELTLALDGRLDDLFATALRLDAPLQFLGQPHHMDGLHALIARFDGLRLIVDHLCHPNPSEGPGYERWQRFFDLASYERCYVKVSLQANCSKAPWPFADLHGFTKRTLDAFGPARCMWGSNYPLIPPELSYGQVLAVVRDQLPFLTGADLDLVLGGTAASLWQPIGS